MITVVISTSNRLHYLKKTMSDLTRFKEIIDKVIVLSFNDFKTENYIKYKFSKKFKELIIIHSRCNFELENRIRQLSFQNQKLIKNSKYIWFMNDKDRILTKNCNSVKMILTKNINGLTLNVHSLKDPFFKEKKRNNLDLFNLEKGIHKLGLISSQILNKNLFFKYSKQTKLSAYYLSEIILKIIINEKKWFFFHQKIIGYTHLDQDKSRNKLEVKYLNYRFDEEFNFYVLKLDNYLLETNYAQKDRIIKKAFFKNIISWLVLLKKEESQKNFSKKILKINKNLKKYKLIKLILLCSVYTPNVFINLLKKFKKLTG